jgi:anti-sigma factor RsiW
MCDVQAKLIARLDRELPKDEAIALERHIEGCEECRRWATACGQASDIFDAYCDAVMAAKAPRQVPRWVPVLSGAVVVAGALFLALPRMRVERPLVGSTTTVASVAVAAPPPAEPALGKIPVHRRHGVPRVQEYAATAQPMDTAIEIAIPAEAMFPPGAMPYGISFIADLRIAPDGSVRQVHLRQ